MTNENRDRNREFLREGWKRHEEALLEHVDPRPFRVTQEAYRRLERVDRFRSDGRLYPEQPNVGAAITSALAGIENAKRLSRPWNPRRV
jgi:hypothetical protein